MNAARQHTDGEHHTGETTRIIPEAEIRAAGYAEPTGDDTIRMVAPGYGPGHIDQIMHDLHAVTARHDACLDQARTLIRLHLVGLPALVLRRRLMSDDHGAFSAGEVSAAMAELTRSGWARISPDGRFHQRIADAAVPADFLAKADAYRAIRAKAAAAPHGTQPATVEPPPDRWAGLWFLAVVLVGILCLLGAYHAVRWVGGL